MKKYIAHVGSKVNFWNLFIGIVIGFGVGVYALNALIPNSNEVIRMYRMDKQSLSEDRAMQHGGHNPYMMTAVTSEKQFLEEMIKHHEAAVLMAQQVLTITSSVDIKKLANDIISAQTTEIKTMRDWLPNFR